jgi:hypothetical protein
VQKLKDRVWSVLEDTGPLTATEVASHLCVEEPEVRQAMQLLVFEDRIRLTPVEPLGEHRFEAARAARHPDAAE